MAKKNVNKHKKTKAVEGTDFSMRLVVKKPLQVYNSFRKQLNKYAEENGIDKGAISGGDKRKFTSVVWQYAKNNFQKTKKDKRLFYQVFSNLDEKSIERLAKESKNGDKKSREHLKYIKKYRDFFFDNAIESCTPKTPKETTPKEPISADSEELDEYLSKAKQNAELLRDKYNGSGYFQAPYVAKDFFDMEIDSYYSLFFVEYSDDYAYAQADYEPTPIRITKADNLNRDELASQLDEIGDVLNQLRIRSQAILGVDLDNEKRTMIVWIDYNEDGICPLKITDFYPEYILPSEDIESSKEIMRKKLEEINKRKNVYVDDVISENERLRIELERAKQELERLRKSKSQKTKSKKSKSKSKKTKK